MRKHGSTRWSLVASAFMVVWLGCNDGGDDDSSSSPPPITPAVEDADNDGYTSEGGDCNDDDASSYPGAPEVDDGRDNDCDGQIDEDTGTQTPGPTLTPDQT